MKKLHFRSTLRMGARPLIDSGARLSHEPAAQNICVSTVFHLVRGARAKRPRVEIRAAAPPLLLVALNKA